MIELEVKVPCPQCKRPIPMKVREMVPGGSRACPNGCGATITFTGDDGQKVGVFRADPKPIVCAKILYGALDEMVTNWILSKKAYPLEPMAGEVLKIFLGGILLQ